MKKRVCSSNLALRFYRMNGWDLETLNQYLLSGEFFDTSKTPHQDPVEDSYFILKPYSKLDIEALYRDHVGEVVRAFDDYPHESDLEFLKRMCW